MPNLKRFAMIELGSNNIRYMVADFEDATSFTTVFSDTAKHSIHPNQPLEPDVLAANAQVSDFLNDADSRGCDTVFAYGTAACRRVVELLPGVLSPSIRVLSPKEEALAAWVAGFSCTPMADGTTCTVIDQGSGSTEIVRATWSGSAFEHVAYFSAHIGSIGLVEQYKESSKSFVERVNHVIASMIPDFDAADLVPEKSGKLFLIGGAATSVGWLATKGSAMQNYRPSELAGARITMPMMQDLLSKLSRAYRENPRAARMAVDARRGSEDHILKVLSSLPFLAVLAGYFDPDGPYYVSGLGVRHGIGFMLWHGLL